MPVFPGFLEIIRVVNIKTKGNNMREPYSEHLIFCIKYSFLSASEYDLFIRER